MISENTRKIGARRLGLGLIASGLLAILPACQSTQTKAPRAALSDVAAGPTIPAPPEATQPMPPAVSAAEASFRFDQILGVPTNKTDTLARGIADSARARMLHLVRRSDPTATYRVMGYLSAVGGDAGVNVTYVWDIVDAQNNRVHRFAGIEIAGKADADPWSQVSDEVLRAISARTVEDIYAWINRLPSPAAGAAAAAKGGPATL
ncbi:hypothetical protein [Oryzibacter oryziterrae]|uniref:hypothetical protein n=1 Tax=Oryzibacter oryziterrae TaxID=2766474 RepID=UPI001F3D88E0|nr:hypothetical protein [Oryzibacter oryziterrae]